MLFQLMKQMDIPVAIRPTEGLKYAPEEEKKPFSIRFCQYKLSFLVTSLTLNRLLEEF